MAILLLSQRQAVMMTSCGGWGGGQTTSLANSEEVVEGHVISVCAGEGRGTVTPLVVQVSQQTTLARLLQRLAAVAVQGGDGGQQRGVPLSADHG